MPKTVTLIISFYNRIDYLKLIFAGLEQQSYRDFEVIIADDGSGTEIVREVKSLIKSLSFPVKHLWHADNGWQKNIILNKAIVEAESDYLIFIDGDCIPNRYFIEEHLKSKTTNQTVCGRRVTLTKKISTHINVAKVQSKCFHMSIFFQLLLPSIFGKEQTRIRHMIRIKNKNIRRLFLKDKNKGILGCNFSTWKEDLMKVNGFDERFIYPGIGEDTDLESRLKKNGVQMVSKKSFITVYHMYHKTLGQFDEMNYRLYKENHNNKVTFTPYGIKKH